MPQGILEMLLASLRQFETLFERSDCWCSINCLFRQLIDEIAKHDESYISQENAESIYIELLEFLMAIDCILSDDIFDDILNLVICDKFQEIAEQNQFSLILERYYHVRQVN